MRSVSGVEVEGHLWTRTGRGRGWRLGPQVEVLQDPANDRWIGQQRHQLSSASASMTTQDVDREHPAHRLRPAVGMRTGRWGRWSWRGKAGLCSGVQESEETCEPDALGCGLGRAGGLAVCTEERTGWCVAGGGGRGGACSASSPCSQRANGLSARQGPCRVHRTRVVEKERSCLANSRLEPALRGR